MPDKTYFNPFRKARVALYDEDDNFLQNFLSETAIYACNGKKEGN